MSERRVCAFWVLVQTDDNGRGPQYNYRCVAAESKFTGQEWTEDDITCFNNAGDDEEFGIFGMCDGEGKCHLCSKYAPGGMAFGLFDPATQGYRLPFIFAVYNLRAKISKCCNWDSSTSDDYTVDEINAKIVGVTNRCSKGSLASAWNDPDQPTDPEAVDGVYYEIPCNGAKPECPYYTGIPWEYCVDEKMAEGERILGEQIQELRLYSDDWNSYDNPLQVFRGRYINPDIWAWEGSFAVKDKDTGDFETEAADMAWPEHINYPILDKVYIENSGNELTTNITSEKKIRPTGGTVTENEAPTYPTLIRELNDAVLYRPKIHFPYNNYIHKHWTDEGNIVTIIGTHVAAAQAFVVNGNLASDFPKATISKMQIALAKGDPVDSTLQTEFNNAVQTFLVNKLWYDPDSVYTITPDENSGYFLIEDVELEIGKSQDLYVFSQDANSDWYVQSIRVHDYMYHMFMLQTEFEQEWYWDDDLGPGSHIRGVFAHMSGRKEFDYGISFEPSMTIQNFYWRNKENSGGLHPLTGQDLGIERWSYYRVRKLVGETKIASDNWKILSSCGEILATVDDININRPYGWEIVSANVVGYRPDGTEVSFELEVDYPSSLTSLTESLPANVVVLKPKDGEDPQWFSSDDATLTINYNYFVEKKGTAVIEPEDDEELVEPTGSGKIIEYAIWSTYVRNNLEFYMTPIRERTQSYRADVADEEGRIIGTKTQKMLTQYKKILCRDYEIYYAWQADYLDHEWFPSYWICDAGPEDRVTGKSSKTMTPTCGDHELGPEMLFLGFTRGSTGPMWYPYAECNSTIYYQAAAIANTCALPLDITLYPDAKASTHRLRGPDSYYHETWGDAKPSIYQCKVDYRYGYYEKFTEDIFVGRGNARGELNLVDYQNHQWRPPQFGNVLREQVWINRCIDYINYFDFQAHHLYYTWKWMPITEYWCDQDDLFSENTLHPFMFMQCDDAAGLDISETDEDVNRYKYEEVVVSKLNRLIQYPSEWGPQVYYQFLDDSIYQDTAVQWLYREKWKDIERNDEDENKVTCATLSYPDYAWGYPDVVKVRDQFQKTADEGEYNFIFTPPVYEADEIKSDAYFQILPGPKRYIDLQTLTWKDDEAMEGGTTITPLYKEWATGDEWDSDPTLWTERVDTGDHAEAEDKENYYKTYNAELDEEYGHHYFKGVNIELRNDYFPYEVSEYLNGSEYDTAVKINAPTGHLERDLDPFGSYHPYNERLSVYNRDSIDDNALQWGPEKRTAAKEVIIDIGQPISVNTLQMEVLIGHFTDIVGSETVEYVGILPNIEVYASNSDTGGWVSWYSFDEIEYDTAKTKRPAYWESSEIVITPTAENIATRYRYFKFVIGNWDEAGAAFLLGSIGFKEMNFTAVSETIKLYERKFYKTTGTSHDFVVHGTETHGLLGSVDDYSTLYNSEPLVRGVVGIDEYEIANKCRSQGGYIKYVDKDPNDYLGEGSSLEELEGKQKEFWDRCANELLPGGESNYRVVLHQKFNEYLESLGMSFPEQVLTLISTSPEIEEIFDEIDGTATWAAQGHQYVPHQLTAGTEVCGGFGTPMATRRRCFTYDYCLQHFDLYQGGVEGQPGCQFPYNAFQVYAYGVAGPTLGAKSPGGIILV